MPVTSFPRPPAYRQREVDIQGRQDNSAAGGVRNIKAADRLG
jgi:hypothetical protein